MNIREVMTSNPECVSPGDSIQSAARIMRDCDTGAVPVVGVAVRHIDGRQLLTRTCDELRQVGHVCANVLCIDQDGI